MGFVNPHVGLQPKKGSLSLKLSRAGQGEWKIPLQLL